jgi:hypothetical protein
LSSGAGGRLMRRWDTANYIDGFLLNARVYDRALSNDEILQNYNAHGTPSGMISENLIVQLDAGNILSYPGSGTAWKSLVSSIQNNGTLTNGPSFSFDNKGCIVFDGINDYVALPLNFFNHDAGTPFTVSIWFITTNAGGTLFGQQGSSNPSSSSGGYVPAIYVNANGKMVTSCFWGGSTNDISVSSASVNDGNWHNITVAFASGSQKTYLDGVLTGTVSKTQTTYSSNYYYFLGAGYSEFWPLASGYYFNGRVGYMSFYNAELTGAQVLQNYNAISNRYI